jgi:hypothetical protein
MVIASAVGLICGEVAPVVRCISIPVIEPETLAGRDFIKRKGERIRNECEKELVRFPE